MTVEQRNFSEENNVDFYGRLDQFKEEALVTDEPVLILPYGSISSAIAQNASRAKYARGERGGLTIGNIADTYLEEKGLSDELEVARLEDPQTGEPAYYFRRTKDNGTG